MRSYSNAFKRAHNATGGAEVARVLLEITNPALAQPIRIVNDTLDLTHQGNTFVSFGFDAELPDDTQGKLPRARLRMDNAGEDLTEWLDASRGGVNSQVRFIQVLRSNPDTIEWEVTMDLTNVGVDWIEVSGELGFEDLLNLPAMAQTYRPQTAPGLF
jgi:hypothetical protein